MLLCISILYFVVLPNNILLDLPHFIYLSVDGHLEFYFLVIINNAAMYICIQVFASIIASNIIENIYISLCLLLLAQILETLVNF